MAAPLSALRRMATAAGAKVADADRALAAFAGEGLVTVDAGQALLTHDAVLTAWPRLRDWLEEDAATARDERRATSSRPLARDSRSGRTARAGRNPRARGVWEEPEPFPGQPARL